MDHRLITIVVMGATLLLAQSDIKLSKLFSEKLQYSETLMSVEKKCDQFFFGTSFPRMKNPEPRLVKLCQTQQHDGYIGPAVYATLYSITNRIPVYSAAVVILYPNCTGYDRPEEKFWHRVSLGLCDVDPQKLPSSSISSRLGSAGSGNVACGKFQAINRDYIGNQKLLGVDRGHLNPNFINSQNLESQIATFALTNAAPQFSLFNQIAWMQYECMTEFVILKHVPMERVYIMTGTLGVARDADNNPIWMNEGGVDDKNPVKVPGYYWKAVCYPGNQWEGSAPWGFVVMDANVNSHNKSTPEKFMNLKDFSSTYFEDDIFLHVCLDAGLGPIEQYFDKWYDNVDDNCPNHKGM